MKSPRLSPTSITTRWLRRSGSARALLCASRSGRSPRINAVSSRPSAENQRLQVLPRGLFDFHPSVADVINRDALLRGVPRELGRARHGGRARLEAPRVPALVREVAVAYQPRLVVGVVEHGLVDVDDDAGVGPAAPLLVRSAQSSADPSSAASSWSWPSRYA